jgi:uncharacterized membrane protein
MLSLRIVGKQWWWLLLWTMLGAGLRLANLDGKPPWSDEFRTLVLSVGNSFASIPLDRVINIQDLLTPLIPNPSATIDDIIRRVSIEDRQPPIYFVLAHLWMKLFPTQGGLVDLWGARALAAGWGILTIPCAYVCSYLTFRSQPADPRSAGIIANLTAGMLAVSPYGVFISQEARHYSLAILWVTISINCLAIACRYLDRQQKLPIPLLMVWIAVNILGLGTHYLFSIALLAEIIALGLVWWWQIRTIEPKSRSGNAIEGFYSKILLQPIWRRLGLILVGTVAGGAIWWWQLVSTYDRHIHGWIDNAPHKLIEVINPFFQIVGALISMMSLLLVEVTELPPLLFLSEVPIDINIPIVILSAILMLIFFAWAMPMLNRGLKLQLRQLPTQKIGTISLGSFTVSALGLYLIIPWITGIDITRGARYHFVYFPAIVMSIGLGLASCWRSKPSIAKWVSGKQAVAIVLSMGLVSSTIVASNYGYHKYYRSEQIVPMMRQSAPIPVLVATTHNSLVQVGELMGLAWQLRSEQPVNRPGKTQFLLAHQWQKFCTRDCAATNLLHEIVDRFSGPIDVWLVNFYAPVQLPSICGRDKKFTKGVYGYQYQLYHCQPLQDNATSSLDPTQTIVSDRSI